MDKRVLTLPVISRGRTIGFTGDVVLVIGPAPRIGGVAYVDILTQPSARSVGGERFLVDSRTLAPAVAVSA